VFDATSRFRRLIVFLVVFVSLCSLGAYAQSPAPTLTSIEPAAGSQGSTINVQLRGNGFHSSSKIAFSTPGIVVQSAQVVSPQLMEATIVLSALPGRHSVIVVNTGGSSQIQSFSILDSSVGDTPQLEAQAIIDGAFYEPYKAWAHGGYLYVTDYSYSTVSRVALASGTATILAGQPDQFGSNDGQGSSASFGHPAGVWADNNYVFVTDAYFDTVRRITLATGEVTTIAGSPISQSGSLDGLSSFAQFRSPNGIWGDGINLYVCDTMNFTIRKIAIETGKVTTLAGAARSRGVEDGVGVLARFYGPTDLWGDGYYLYVTDGNAIRRVSMVTGEVKTLAGTPSTAGYLDAVGPSARFDSIAGIWGDGVSVFVADSANNVVRKLRLDTLLVSTVAGDPLGAGQSTSGQTKLNTPTDVAGDGTSVYIVDSLNFTTLRGIPASRPEITFRFTDRTGISMATSGTRTQTQVGYARVRADAGSITPAGLAIFGFRANGVLVSEATVVASSLIQNGRIYAEFGAGVNTGIAIANPNPQPANVSFYLTDDQGAMLYSSSTQIAQNAQVAAFIDQAPFAPPANMGVDLSRARTITLSSSMPIAVTGIRGFTNQRSEFLMTTLPVAKLDSASVSNVVFPQFAEGNGWATRIVLVNPGASPLEGVVEFFDGNGGAGERQPYNIPPRGAIAIHKSDTAAELHTGWVRVRPFSGTATPSGLLILTIESDGVVVSETGLPALPESSASLMYAEASGDLYSGKANWIRSGLAISNASATPALVNIEYLDFDGISNPLSTSITIPPTGQTAKFLDEFPGFENLHPPYKGVLRITGPPIGILGLRARYNERGDFLFSATPPVAESDLTSYEERIFAHVPDGGGLTTQFVLFGGSITKGSSGSLRFTSQSGTDVSFSLSR
jgi:hypothetical protein